ncbi:MAG: nucleoside deaminase [Planctomycetota bacterium]
MNIQVEIPQWVVDANRDLPEFVPSIEERMEIVIRFAELNFQKATGGPFAAGIFETDTGRLIYVGVNRVVPTNYSCMHAEIVAISLAQQKLGTVDLGGPGMPSHQLVVNGRPCAMCCGAIPWSGVRSVVIGASGDQIESIAGFDEGPIHPDWRIQLQQRGIEVIEDVLAEQACRVFHQFRESGEPIYNGRRGDDSRGSKECE